MIKNLTVFKLLFIITYFIYYSYLFHNKQWGILGLLYKKEEEEWIPIRSTHP